MISFVTSYPATLFAALFAVLLVALLVLRLYRTRRVEILAGSLLLWRRLALQQPRVKPPRIVIDRSLLLQAAALALLVFALAAPQLDTNPARGRGLLLVLDNAPMARARLKDGSTRWPEIQQRAEFMLNQLVQDDRVFVAQSSPVTKVLTQEGSSAAEARGLLGTVPPALTARDPLDVWQGAVNLQRALRQKKDVALIVLSPRDPPPGVDPAQWQTIAPREPLRANAAIVQVGAANVLRAGTGNPLRDGKPEVEILARVHNFSDQELKGAVTLTGEKVQQSVDLKIPPHDSAASIFELPANWMPTVTLRWSPAGGQGDALPEDDAVTLLAQKQSPPRIRFHTALPVLQKLYQKALEGAVFLDAASTEPADLDIFVNNLPGAGSESRALLLIAPPGGYQSVFEVGDRILAHPRVQLDEEFLPLTLGFKDSPEGIFPVMKAREILRTGNFKTLFKDGNSTEHRALAAAFRDDAFRQCFLLSFVPGDELPPDQTLSPALAALLLRMALQAAGNAEPFVAATAAQLEEKSGAPLPLNWNPERAGAGEGVLNAATSAAATAIPSTASSPNFERSALPLLSASEQVPLAPWLIVLALLLLLVDLWCDLPVRKLKTA